MPSAALISTAAGLDAALARLAPEPWVTVDTEFLRIDTYRPRLCLVQLGAPGVGYVLDAIALEAELPRLWTFLQAPERLKVLHAAGQDMEIFAVLGGACPTPLFDTQVAAALLGLGDQMGYGALVQLRNGVTLDKSLSRTDWSRRPLSRAELDYAVADVTELAALYPALRQELEAANRMAWLEEDCARQTTLAHYLPQPETAWQRLKGLGRLNARQQPVAAALAAWREHQAVASNRPRSWILDDAALYAIAEAMPRDAATLARIPEIPPKTQVRHAAALLHCVSQALDAGPKVLVADDRLSSTQKATLSRLREAVQKVADAHRLPAGLLAPRAELEAILYQGPTAAVRCLQGWREGLLSGPLTAAL